MMTLYHGSNLEIEEINLAFSKKGKDFGCGFYLNPDYTQALDMARRTTRTLGTGRPTVSAFDFDESLLSTPGSLKIKIFEDYSTEWAEFVLKNRNNVSDIPTHDYDIVVGPIADDSVGVQLRRYMMGYIPLDTLIEELRFRGNHAVQYFFGTPPAINHLSKKSQ